eukprot:1797453-Pleurochrysis_carterae.AAC.1
MYALKLRARAFGGITVVYSLAPQCAVAFSQFGALRCSPLAVWRLALSLSRSPAPCAVRLSQPGALR